MINSTKLIKSFVIRARAQLGLVNLLPVAVLASSCCAAYEVHKNRVTNSAKLKPDTVRSCSRSWSWRWSCGLPNERVNSAKINQSWGEKTAKTANCRRLCRTRADSSGLEMKNLKKHALTKQQIETKYLQRAAAAGWARPRERRSAEDRVEIASGSSWDRAAIVCLLFI